MYSDMADYQKKFAIQLRDGFESFRGERALNSFYFRYARCESHNFTQTSNCFFDRALGWCGTFPVQVAMKTMTSQTCTTPPSCWKAALEVIS